MNKENLPTNWKIVKLGEITNITSGGTPDRSNLEYWNGNIPWVKTGEINYKIITKTEETISKKGLENSSAKIVPAGTLLMAMYGQGITRGRVAILSIDAAINQACAAISVFRDISSDYLFYYLTYKYQDIRDLGHGANQRNLNSALIKSINISLPTLPEQQAIARALRAVQQAKEARQRELELERERKAALMDYLFTHGTRGEKLKQTEIGEMPESWEVKKLGDITKTQSGGTPPRNKPGFYNGQIPWIKILDLNDEIVLNTDEKITLEGFQSIRGKLNPIDTVMVAMYGGAGTIGKCGMLGVQAITNQAICCLQPNTEKILPFYLLYYLILIRPRWMQYAIGTRKDPNISKGIVERMQIPLSPLNQQQEIVDLLQSVTGKTKILYKEICLLDELFRAMLEELMTGRLSAMALVEGNE